MAQLSAKGGAQGAGQIEIVAIDPLQTIKESRGNGEEDNQHRHHDLGAHTKTKPQHQQRGEGEDRNGLAGQYQRH